MFLDRRIQTANFEELIGKVKDAREEREPGAQQQLAGWKVFKAAEPSGQECAISGDDRSRSPCRRASILWSSFRESLDSGRNA